MKYKAVICDLDGTLLHHGKISETTKDVIKQVRKAGIKFYIATGRHHLDAKYFKEILGLDTFLISSNGAKIHNDLLEEVYSVTLPEHVKTELINLSVDELVEPNIFLNDAWLGTKGYQGTFGHSQDDTGFVQKVVESFTPHINDDIIKFFYLSPDEKKLEILNEHFNKKFGGSVSIAFSAVQCLEIMQMGVSKGNAIKHMLELENLKPEEVVAFGDGMNDLEMLSVVGKGFVMGNANPKLKYALPHNEVIGNCEDDGVAKKLIELFIK